jgi:DNA-directed RNA polymerase sigma subunit (sigma70/sigma32)
VIEARLNGESYAAIGREHKVSGDTIRRIEAKAIRALRWLLKEEETT